MKRLARYGWLGLCAVLTFSGIAHAAPPANDEIQGVEEMPGEGFITTVLMTEATANAADPSCGTKPQQSMWYRYTAVTNQLMTATLYPVLGYDSPTRPRISVWSGRPGALELVACNADAHALKFDAVAGTAYYFEVYLPKAAGETWTELHVVPAGSFGGGEPESNDLYWYAETISQLPFSATHVNVTAGIPDADYNIHASADLGALWYEYTATRKQQVDAVFTAGTEITGNAGMVYVMTGTFDDPVVVAEGLLGARFTTEPGVTYKIKFEAIDSPWYGDEPYVDLAVRPSAPLNEGTIVPSKTIKSHSVLKWAPRWQYVFPGFYQDKYLTFNVDITCKSPIASAMPLFVELKQDGIILFSGQEGTISCKNGRGSTLVTMRFQPRPGAAQLTVGASDFTTNYNVSSGPQQVQVVSVRSP